ncbi:MAG: hypothetical protein U1F41_17225 [Burkholderiales bacterium]
MPSARELLEQADALMRRNRSPLMDDIPVLTDSVPEVVRRREGPGKSPEEGPGDARADASSGPDTIPVLTESVTTTVDDEPKAAPPPVARAVVVDEGDASTWLRTGGAGPSVIGDAPDSIARVPAFVHELPEEIEVEAPLEVEEAFDEELALRDALPGTPAGAGAPSVEPAAALEAEEASPVVESPVVEPPVVESPVVESPVVEPPVVESPVVESPAVEPPIVEPPVVEPTVVEPTVVESTAPAPLAWEDESPAIAAAAALAPVPAMAIHFPGAAAPAVGEAPGKTAEEERTAAEAALKAAEEERRAADEALKAAGEERRAAEEERLAAEEARRAADEARRQAEDARWASMAEEIRMQVLQRIDLFTDTGLRDQLGGRLQPIVDRASADLVATINQHVGDLLRAYVAEAIEREIDNWKRNTPNP